MPDKQPSLFPRNVDVALQTVKFHGSDLETSDIPRLARQRQAVFDVMNDGGPWTAETVHDVLKIEHPTWPVQSIDRQMRYLKDIPGWTVEKESRGNGLFVYRLMKEE